MISCKEGKIGFFTKLWLSYRFGLKAFHKMKDWELHRGDVINIMYELEVK